MPYGETEFTTGFEPVVLGAAPSEAIQITRVCSITGLMQIPLKNEIEGSNPSRPIRTIYDENPLRRYWSARK